MFRKRGVAGSNPASSAKRPGQGVLRLTWPLVLSTFGLPAGHACGIGASRRAPLRERVLTVFCSTGDYPIDRLLAPQKR
jgi:hypothetical protein